MILNERRSALLKRIANKIINLFKRKKPKPKPKPKPIPVKPRKKPSKIPTAAGVAAGAAGAKYVKDLLKKYSEGLICTNACLAG